MTVHKLDVRHGKSLTVLKKCAMEESCTKDTIGCKPTDNPDIQVHVLVFIWILTYCRVPEGRGLHQSARPLSRDETRSVNPLVLIKYTG